MTVQEPLGPVVPEGYQLTGMIAPQGMMPAPRRSGSGLTQESLEDRQARINAVSGRPVQYGGSTLTMTPLAVRQAEVNAAAGGPALYSGMALTPEGQAYKRAFTPNQQQLAAMQARPDMAQRYVDATTAGRERVAAIGDQRRERIRQQMEARARAMRGNDGFGSLMPFMSMLVPGVGTAMGLYGLTQGKNTPMDYLKVAKAFI